MLIIPSVAPSDRTFMASAQHCYKINPASIQLSKKVRPMNSSAPADATLPATYWRCSDMCQVYAESSVKVIGVAWLGR